MSSCNGLLRIMQSKQCIESFYKDGLPFVAGNFYEFEFNPLDGRLYIYTVWGYTDISIEFLNRKFI